MAKLKKTLLAFTLLLLVACAPESNVLKVGTIAGPETALMEVAKTVMQKKYNIPVKIIEFTDYSIPNAALNDGSIDANVFQHQLFLQTEIQAHQYAFTTLGKTFIYPMGIYSKKITELNQLPSGATIAIPNDPSNGSRALLLLQSAGLITLKPKHQGHYSLLEIIKNPQHLHFKELASAQLPRVLPDVDLAVINTNYALLAQLLPQRDALYLEKKDAPYANLIVVKTTDKEDPRLQKLVDALHSQAVLDKARELFNKQAIPAWK